MVKVGLIGIGFMGHTHYQIYKGHKQAKVVALADYNKAKLAGDWSSIGGNLGDSSRRREDMSGIATYSDPFKLLKDPNVDMIDICLPTDLHHKVAMAALKTGKHVFVEKPMARTAKQASAIAKASVRRNKYFMVGHCIRFWPEYEVAYKLIKSKKYGKVKEMQLRRVAGPPTYTDKNWQLNAKRSGGAALDLQIHDADFALYLLGKPKKISAWGSKGPSGGIDVLHAAFDYPGNVRASIVAGWGYHPTFPFNMEFCIRCEKATFLYSMASGVPLTIYTDKGKEIQPKVPAGTGWSRELDYFIKCIVKNTKPSIVTAASSLESVKLVEAQLKSIEKGKPVAYK